jgi:hypothetical protein
MNKFLINCFLICLSVALYSCSSTDATNNSEEPTTEESISTRAGSSEETLEEDLIAGATEDMSKEEAEFFFYISRKWELGEEYINMKGNGLFDAVLEGKTIVGKWGMVSSTEDSQVLKLIGTGEDEGYNKTFEIINISLNRLEAMDENGKRIQFLASN